MTICGCKGGVLCSVVIGNHQVSVTTTRPFHSLALSWPSHLNVNVVCLDGQKGEDNRWLGKEEEKVGEDGGRLELDRSAVVENQFWEQYFQKHTVGDREGEHWFTKCFQ